MSKLSRGIYPACVHVCVHASMSHMSLVYFLTGMHTVLILIFCVLYSGGAKIITRFITCANNWGTVPPSLLQLLLLIQNGCLLQARVTALPLLFIVNGLAP